MKMKWTVTAMAAALTTAQAAQAAPTTEALLDMIEQQQSQITELKQQVEATADAVESGSTGNSWADNTQLGGYGEHHFNHYRNGIKDDAVDAHRYVLFISHKYSDSIRFFSELELEHSLAGEGKPGEVELEQAYIQWDYTENHNAVIGQFLIPVGLINETHEPETFYGTERNPVEKNIIPATWWETGVMMQGELGAGFSYNAAIHSGLKDEGLDIRSGRQKSAKATAEELAYTGRIKYTGVAGLEIAATYQFQQDLTQGADATTEAAEATLYELHARYSFADVTLTGLYAMWDVDGKEAEALGRDEQEGYFVEASYKVTPKLGVFTRLNEWDEKAGSDDDTEQEQWDWGVNYWLHENVVLKADWSDQRHDGGADSINLGVGWSF